jgi:hypothetical protein
MIAYKQRSQEDYHQSDKILEEESDDVDDPIIHMKSQSRLTA